METQATTTISHIESLSHKIREHVRENPGIQGLEEHFAQDADVIALSEFLNVGTIQTALLTAFLSVSIEEERSPSIKALSQFFNCGVYEILALKSQIGLLIERGYALNEQGSSADSVYKVPEKILEQILKGEPFISKLRNEYAFTDVLEYADRLFVLKQNRNITLVEINHRLEKLEKELPDLEFYSIIKKYDLCFDEKILLLALCLEHINDTGVLDLDYYLYSFYDSVSSKARIKRGIWTGKNKLLLTGIVQFCADSYKTDKTIELSQKGVELFIMGNEIGTGTKVFNSGPCTLIDPVSIDLKHLFFNREEEIELDRLKQALHPNRFDSLLARLKENKMPLGLNCIFYGKPGTGKTESIYQLAKATGRVILMVNISEIRDKYIGESEKRLKSIFSTYSKALKHFEQAPILLFNEADALLGRRIKVSHYSDQMNNTMQNILLQEMEDFKGILFATTNMQESLDTAFERRFLFKVKFNQPKVKARIEIWKQQFSLLQEEELERLATSFDYNGGQIQNVARKVMIDCIMNNKTPGITEIEDACIGERFKNDLNKPPIGYMKSGKAKK